MTDLERLIALWRETRDPRLANAIEHLGRSVRPLDPLPGKTLGKKVEAWLALAAANDPHDTSRLVAFPFPTGIQYLTAIVEGLLAMPDDPRVASRLIDLIEQAPRKSRAGDKLLERATTRLIELRDVRAYERFRAAAQHDPGLEPTIRAFGAALRFRMADEAAYVAFLPPARDAAREEALYAEIYAHPDDDAPRAVYADYLVQHGDPRGEFIALQLRGATMYDARCARLLVEHRIAWAAPLGAFFSPTTMRFERGFFIGGTLEHPIDAVLDRHPAWRLITEIRIEHFGDLDRVATPSVRKLELTSSIDAKRAISTESVFARFPALRDLSLLVTDEEALTTWVATASAIDRLEHLRLQWVSPRVIAALEARANPLIVEEGGRAAYRRSVAPGPFTCEMSPHYR